MKKPILLNSRRVLHSLLLLVLLFAVAVPSVSASIIIPSNVTTAFIQTTGPNAGLNIGDYRTNAAGDNLPHEIVVNVACTPGQTYIFQVFDPAIDAAGNPPGVGVDGVTVRVTDEVRGGLDTTNFVLLSPGGATLANNNYASGTSDADWATLATVNSTGTPGADCGQYTLRTSTSNDDDNAWRFRLVGGPALPPAETFDPAIGPDGVADTGDESSVGILSVSYQHVVGGCQDFFWFVQNGTPSIFMLAFDMDGAGSITYQSPSGATITGTVSGNAVWNDAAPQQTPRPTFADMNPFDIGAADLIGDATLNPEPGLWRATICIPSANNQYSFEVGGVPVFLAPPDLPDVVITKDDGVVLVNSPGATTYTLSIVNNGPGPAMPIAGPEVVDTLPAGETFNSCTVNPPLSGTCGESAPGSGIININLTGQAGPPAFLSYLPGPAATPRNSGSVTLTVNIAGGLAGGSTLDNPATVDWSDIFGNDYPPNSDNDVDTVVAAASSADLSLTKNDGTATYTPGGTTTYTITVRNNGPDNVTGATVTDNFPAAITNASWTCVATGVATCTAGPVVGNINDTVNINAGAGNFLTYTVVATIAAGATGNLTNTACVAAPAGVADPTAGNNCGTDTDTPPGGPTATATPSTGTGGGCVGCGGGSPTSTPGPVLVDPVITKEASVDTARIGDPVTFKLIVTNPNSVPVTNVVVNDPIPAQFDFVSVSTTFGSCSYDSGSRTVNCNLGQLAPQQVVTITINTRVNNNAHPPETVRNVMLVEGDRPDRRYSGQASDSVTIIPEEIPVTGVGPGLREMLVVVGLMILAALTPLAAWLFFRRARRGA